MINRKSDDSIIVLMPDGAICECMTIQSAADLFGYSERHMLTMVDTGAYPAFKHAGRWFVIVGYIELHAGTLDIE